MAGATTERDLALASLSELEYDRISYDGDIIEEQNVEVMNFRGLPYHFL